MLKSKLEIDFELNIHVTMRGASHWSETNHSLFISRLTTEVGPPGVNFFAQLTAHTNHQ
jgi:hypothetical protein